MILFLDIDGVLNQHEKRSDNFTGIRLEQVMILNSLLHKLPDLKIVISSAWRYQILQGDMTLAGFEIMLRSHGLAVEGRIVGCTLPDGDGHLNKDFHDRGSWTSRAMIHRAGQILAYVLEADLTSWLALDDLLLPLPEEHFYKTDPAYGLTFDDVDNLLRKLQYDAVRGA